MAIAYEYKVVRCQSLDSDEIESVLNTYGADGWRLDQVVEQDPRTRKNAILVFVKSKIIIKPKGTEKGK